MLEKTVRVNFLFDFYQALLTSKQRDYMDMYYLKDFSLGEIAENAGVSRQAIYDNIKRTEAMLESYEQILHLYENFQKRMTILKELEMHLNDSQYEKAKACINNLKYLD